MEKSSITSYHKRKKREFKVVLLFNLLFPPLQFQSFYALLESVAQFVGIEVEVWGSQRDEDGFGTRQDRIGSVVLVEGGEDDDFVTGVTHRHQGCHHGLCATAGDGEVGVRMDIKTHEAGQLFG